MLVSPSVVLLATFVGFVSPFNHLLASLCGRGPREFDTVIIRRCKREFHSLPPPSALVVELVRQAGFFGLFNMQHIQLDLALLTALVERWRPETHTFHFTFAEATVTLQDVEIITGLPVDGRPIIGRTDLNWEQIVQDLLGLSLENAVGRRGNKLTLQWLQQHFNGEVEETDTQVQIEQKAHGYIMQLIGVVLVPDQSSSRVHLCYLKLLRGLRVDGQYSWGGMTDSTPPNLATHVVGHYRHSLDMQRPGEVIWQPYNNHLIELLPSFCSAGRNIWRAKVPFINFNIIEMHQLKKVMQQFGYRQLPPEASWARDRSHGMEMKKPWTNWADEHRVHVARWNNRVEHNVPEGKPDIVGAYPNSDEYVTWYKKITVPFVSQMSVSLDKAVGLVIGYTGGGEAGVDVHLCPEEISTEGTSGVYGVRQWWLRKRRGWRMRGMLRYMLTRRFGLVRM
ncbi:hypothetical protein Vadar_007581 [Vaccinium darrowii]|uniref:Uncharacterized protein n=1 Tax=Vaccinium darrowii TaxID=229202 RepID=A0ACB7Z2K9_9ERIC|nr:hypothetical protein Vadar_007581 [Vaccinium darrowii]